MAIQPEINLESGDSSIPVSSQTVVTYFYMAWDRKK